MYPRRSMAAFCTVAESYSASACMISGLTVLSVMILLCVLSVLFNGV